eukprot:g38236.t1
MDALSTAAYAMDKKKIIDHYKSGCLPQGFTGNSDNVLEAVCPSSSLLEVCILNLNSAPTAQAGIVRAGHAGHWAARLSL